MAMYNQSLTPLSDVGNMTEKWLEWRKQFIKYLEMNEYNKKSEDLKIHLLKENIGKHGRHAIDEIKNKNNGKDLNNLEILLEKLNIFFKVPKSEVVERYNFFTTSLKKDESIDNYILKLKDKAETCEFGSLTESLIRDKVITDIKDKGLLSMLLNTENLDLIKLMSICHDHDKLKQAQIEASKKNVNSTEAKTNNETTTSTKNDDSNIKKISTKAKTNNETKTSTKNDVSNIKKIDNQNSEIKRKCWRCNQYHKQRACPAWGNKCEKCGERNHFTNCCRMNTSNIDKEKINLIPGISHLNINHQNNTLKYSLRSRNNIRAANMVPSAPPASEFDNSLYPNLNHTK